MREGTNPNMEMEVRSPPKKVASVITHLPNQDGYHKDRLEIIKVCLTTMAANSGGAPILVWDNDSCEELTNWLREDFKPDFLLLSYNVGKWSARYAIYRMFPREAIVALSDDDMLFYPDWMDKSIELLEHFPNVGVVSCYPVRTQFRWGSAGTRKWAKENVALEEGLFIPDQWHRDFCESIGKDWNYHLEECKDDVDYRITYRGKQAYATAHHCQFLGYAGTISRYVAWTNEALNDEKPFDLMVDMSNLLRLTTIERLSRHMGNKLDEGVRKDLVEMGEWG